MNMKSINQLLGFIALMVSASVFAQTQVPNTFQAGQPARAAEVNENFSTLESAANQNASDIAASATDIASNVVAITNNSTQIQSNSATNQGLEVRVAALEQQVQILFDNLLPPIRVIKDALGTIIPIVDSETWRLSTGLVRVTSVTEEIDPLNPRADLSVTITPDSGFTVTECVLQNQTQVLIGIPANPNLPIDFDMSGVTFANVPGGSALNGELRSGIYFSTLQTIDTTSLTFINSFTPTEGVFFDTGVPSFVRFESSCSQIQNIGFVTNSNVLRVDLYTAPVVPLPVTPPFMSIVN